MNVDEMLADENWRQVLGLPTEWGDAENDLIPRLPLPERTKDVMYAKPFNPTRDIIQVCKSWDNMDREWEGVALLQLRERRWALVSGWCDYTGWGCQDGTSCYVSENLVDLVLFGADDQERQRLGLPDDPVAILAWERENTSY